MHRKTFIQSVITTTMAGTTIKLNALEKITADMGNTDPMPVLFLGHGSPMNAIEDNEFVQGFKNI